MIDDSLVRGTTSRRIVGLLREAGAAEVHVRIASPPVRFPCFYGIDTSAREELIASTASVEQIRERIGADSLAFLPENAMMEAFDVKPGADHGHCNACFTGRYPTAVNVEPCASVQVREPVAELQGSADRSLVHAD
jgi:amidophosphoribosyltransferase